MKSIFILPLFLCTNVVLAQKSTEILPNSITLPRLSTTEQTTVPPQQAGNIIYNTSEKKMALHDGTNWNYLTANAAASGYRNMKVFQYENQIWTVPTGVTKIRVELWGGGQAGNLINTIGADFTCLGGKGGCYALYELNVTPNEDLVFTAGPGGISTTGYFGKASTVKRNNTIIANAFYTTYDSSQYGVGLLNAVEGAPGGDAEFSFQQVESGVFRKIVKTGAGGGTYPFYNNGGNSMTLEFTVPSGVLVGGTSVLRTYGVVGGGGSCRSGVASLASDGRINLYY